jgi:hypothetical protein
LLRASRHRRHDARAARRTGRKTERIARNRRLRFRLDGVHVVWLVLRDLEGLGLASRNQSGENALLRTRP